MEILVYTIFTICALFSGATATPVIRILKADLSIYVPTPVEAKNQHIDKLITTLDISETSGNEIKRVLAFNHPLEDQVLKKTNESYGPCFKNTVEKSELAEKQSISDSDLQEFARTSLKIYREDYIYNPITDAFYKLHKKASVRRIASDACHVEGAAMIQLTSDQVHDVAQVQSMIKNSSINKLAINTNDKKELHSQNVKYECGQMSHGEIRITHCFDNLPFVCKVEAADVPYDEQCGVHAKDFRYIPSLDSCYKVYEIAYDWYESYLECHAVGAHLAVIDSDEERLVIQDMIKDRGVVGRKDKGGLFSLGFSDMAVPGEYTTIFGETLSETVCSNWLEEQPNSIMGDNCGRIDSFNGKFYLGGCGEKYPFVCEKGLKTENGGTTELPYYTEA